MVCCPRVLGDRGCQGEVVGVSYGIQLQKIEVAGLGSVGVFEERRQ